MSHALPVHLHRRFLMASFHSLLPPSTSTEEISQRHAGSSAGLHTTATVDHLVTLDANLADQYSAVYESLEHRSPESAAALDDLTSHCIENLEQHTLAASDAPPASAVSRAARVRRERIVESLTATMSDLKTMHRDGVVAAPSQVYSLLATHLEHSLGVTDSLPGELERSAASRWLHADDDAESDSAAGRADDASEGLSSADKSLDSSLFSVVRTGLEPVFKRISIPTPQSTDEPQTGSIGRSQFLA